MERHKTVDEFINHFTRWNEELKLLRSTLLKSGLEESVKWGMPAYTYQNKNIVGIGAFNSYVGLWFHQGVFLKDEQKKLMNAQENKTKAMRQWRFNHCEEIDEKLILKYVKEAIQNQIDGKEIKPKRTNKTLIIPAILQKALDSNSDLISKFESLSPGKKREFADYISTAKRESTKTSRLSKIIPMILSGIGLNDQYKS